MTFVRTANVEEPLEYSDSDSFIYKINVMRLNLVKWQISQLPAPIFSIDIRPERWVGCVGVHIYKAMNERYSASQLVGWLIT
jgi:hypothetical protein